MNILKKEVGAENGGSTGIDFQLYCPWLIGGQFDYQPGWILKLWKKTQGKKGETVELKDFSE